MFLFYIFTLNALNRLHYGHDALVNRTHYDYNNVHALLQRRSVPNMERRFEAVRSCFGGLAAYKNEGNKLFASQCRYSLLRDVFWTEYNNSAPEDFVEDEGDGKWWRFWRRAGFKYSYRWWLEQRHHNRYSNRSLAELASLRDQYVNLLQMDDERIRKRKQWYRDGDICEHIPFHFCLIDYGFEMAISTRSHLYYFEDVGQREEDKWRAYWQNRPTFTKVT